MFFKSHKFPDSMITLNILSEWDQVLWQRPLEAFINYFLMLICIALYYLKCSCHQVTGQFVKQKYSVCRRLTCTVNEVMQSCTTTVPFWPDFIDWGMLGVDVTQARILRCVSGFSWMVRLNTGLNQTSHHVLWIFKAAMRDLPWETRWKWSVLYFQFIDIS